MGLFRTALVGAAIYGAFKYLTKKDEFTGKSVVDDVVEKTPEWIEKAKNYANEAKASLDQNLNEQPFR